MSSTLNFELNDQDLALFEKAMTHSKKAAEGKSNEEIVARAVGMLADAQKVLIPDFITHWLDGRHEELIDRMHQRRERDFGSGYGSSSGHAHGKASYARLAPGRVQVRLMRA